MKVIQIVWKELKRDYKSILVFTALMSVFFMWFVSFFNPELLEGLEEAFEAYPEAIRLMVGEFASLGEFGGFINIYLFSISWFYFGIYFILKSAQNIPKEIENKTIDLVLSKPITRTELSLGKYLSLILEIMFIFYGIMMSVLVGILIFPTVTVSDIYLNEIMFAFLWNFVFMITLISTGYFFSTFLTSKRALAFGFGLVIFFYAVGQFWKAFPEGAQEIKRISIFFYSDMSNLLVNHVWDNVGVHILILSIYSIVLTILAVMIFNKRDIPV
ncbi:MAG: ABC transporter permease subunit [Promethearchaeota archaeon]|nr:MAG: ABC transporter permease subunit [Candidatus Lokiarchaeota archaeon]